VAGALEHACPVTTGHSAPQVGEGCTGGHHEVAHGSGCGHDHEAPGGGCGHEADCSSDPCAETTATALRLGDESLFVADQPVVFGAGSASFDCLLTSYVRNGCEFVPRALPVVVHTSDLPLLI
jgi:hypothetical protein